MNKIFLCIAMIFTLGNMALGDDHIDGPTITEFPVDLAGIYVFPTPWKPNYLSLVMNANSGVLPGAEFKGNSKFVMELRKLKPSCLGSQCLDKKVSIENTPALKIECIGNPIPLVIGRRWGVRCQFFNGKGEILTKKESVSVRFNRIAELKAKGGGSIGQLYNGKRADPFFISLPTFNDIVFFGNKFGTVDDKRINPVNTNKIKNGIKDVNVLTIALNINLKAVGLEDGLYGFAAQSYIFKNFKYKKVDRAGRAELVNVGLQDSSQTLFLGAGDDPLKKKANAVDIFAESWRTPYSVKQRLSENIKKYDSYDGKQDWNDDQLDKFVKIMSDDYIMINLKPECQNPRGKKRTDYFGIERDLISKGEVQSCGGRDLFDDIFAKSYSTYIGGPSSQVRNYRTGIDYPYQSFSIRKKEVEGTRQVEVKSKLPYLAAPVSFDGGEAFLGLKLYCQNQEEHGADLVSMTTCFPFEKKNSDYHKKVLDGELNHHGHRHDNDHDHSH